MSRNHARLHAGKWEKARRQCFERDKFRCRECGRAGALEAHHEPPLQDGADPYDVENLLTLCRSCHIARHKKPTTPGVEAWKKLVAEMLRE